MTTIESAHAKLADMVAGKTVICSDAQLDALLGNPVLDYVIFMPNPQRVGLLDRYAAHIPARFAKDARKAYALTQQAATVSSQRPNETAHGYAMRIADGA